METMEPVEKGKISRRAVIAGGAVGTAAFWSVPVIDSITSKAAASSGRGLSCGLVYVFYQHADSKVYMLAYEAGPMGGVPCFETVAVPLPCTGTFTSPMCATGLDSTGNNPGTVMNQFTLTGNPGGTTFPAGTATGVGPKGPFGPNQAVAPHSGGGACTGQFVVANNIIGPAAGSNPSDTILAAFAIPNPPSCVGAGWACAGPTPLMTAGTSVNLIGICTPTGPP
jgi:hypothetical protein